MTPFFEPDPASLAEPLADGRFRCRTCGATWWPSLDGYLVPTPASWICPNGCGWKGSILFKGGVPKTVPESASNASAPNATAIRRDEHGR